jgi:hypothetical protein
MSAKVLTKAAAKAEVAATPLSQKSGGENTTIAKIGGDGAAVTRK